MSASPTRMQARKQIDGTAMADLEFLVMNLEGEPLGHVYAPYRRRNWIMSQLADYVRDYGNIRVDRRTAGGWVPDFEWRNLGN